MKHKNSDHVQLENRWCTAWQEADSIVEHIRKNEPTFSSYTVCITDFGARSSQESNLLPVGPQERELFFYETVRENTKAIRKAICHVSSHKGGGTVWTVSCSYAI